MAERPRELGDFKGVGHFEAKFLVQGLRFAPVTLRTTHLLAAYMQNVNMVPLPQWKVVNLCITKSSFMLQTMQKYCVEFSRTLNILFHP